MIGRITIALLGCAFPIAFVGCSSGSPTASGVMPLGDARMVSTGAMRAPVTDSVTGRMGLLESVRLRMPVTDTSPGWLSDQAKSPSPKLYVSDDSANDVFIYSAVKPTIPIGKITSGVNGPVGNFVDANGTLYVANLGGSVAVYPKGKMTPSKTYTAGLSECTDVAVGSDGTLYVSEYPNSAIVEFAPGMMTPARTIAINAVQGVALDSHDNLYATYTNATTHAGAVEKFKPKATSGVDLGIVLGNPGDLKLDRSNNLIVEDQSADLIEFYKSGATQPYGSISNKYTPFKLALNASEKLLYVATGINALDIFEAVPNGRMVTELMSGLQSTTGVSVSPAPPLGS